jgi:ubiquinone/menaquinone biosynthesis C-methylase UbiE
MFKNMTGKFFSGVQESDWYGRFLEPVVQEVPDGSRVLDIGTGSGKLLQLLHEQKSCIVAGTDLSKSMLAAAERKLKNSGAKLIRTTEKPPYPFEENHFDCATICNLLFLLPQEAGMSILKEAQRLVKPDGKIIILSPTCADQFSKLSRLYLKPGNLSILLWYFSTRNNAGKWKQNYLKTFADAHSLSYKKNIGFNGFAAVEILF